MSRSALSRAEAKPQNPAAAILAQQQQQQQAQLYYLQQQQYYATMYGTVPVAAVGGAYPATAIAGVGMVPAVAIEPYAYAAAAAASGAAFAPLQGGDDEYEDPETHNRNAIQLHGNTTNFNINSLLYNNILESDYFKALYVLRTYHEVIQEIGACVKHVEPWQTGTARIPSTAFCLLLKLMLMKLTFKQMNGLLSRTGQPLVRAIGFIYLRYTVYNDLWKWYENYLEDEEEFCPSSNQAERMTIGSFVQMLLTNMSYFGTTLPRIPVPIERKIKVMLLLLENKKKRRKSNLKLLEKGYFAVGSTVRAIYSDETSEPAWYDAVINSVSSEHGGQYKYWVTFPEYGNSELVDLGDMELPKEKDQKDGDDDKKASKRSNSRERDRRDDRDRDRRRRSDSRDNSRRDRSRSRSPNDRKRPGERDRDRDRRRRSNSRSPSHNSNASSSNQSDLMRQVLQSSRDASAAVGKNYASRPVSYKGALALKQDRYTARHKSPSRSPDRFGKPRDRDRERERERERERDRESRNTSDAPSNITKSMSSAQLKEQQDRLKRLKDMYGDASAK